MKEYSGILYMRHFITKKLGHCLTPRYCGLSLPRTPNNSLEGSRYNDSGMYIFEEHLNCTQVTIEFQLESLTNCGQKFFCLQTRRIDISPPLLDKLRITTTNRELIAGTHFIILCGEKYFERKKSCWEHRIITLARAYTQTAQSRV